MVVYFSRSEWGIIMKNYAKYLFLFVTMTFVAACGSTSAVGGAEVSRGDKGSRVGVTNMGDGPEMYGSLRAGASF